MLLLLWVARQEGRRGRGEREKRRHMARAPPGQNKAPGAFFLATLLLWMISVLFEIVFNKRRELLSVVGGFCFYQFANWVIRSWVSKDPLLVNTCVSLLHSSITSASGQLPGFSFAAFSWNWVLVILLFSECFVVLIWRFLFWVFFGSMDRIVCGALLSRFLALMWG